MPFDYMNFKDKHWIGIRIGEYVSHKLIRDLNVAEINKLDRSVAARNWYRFEGYWNRKRINEILDKYGIYIDVFLTDVAEWIDSRIPQAYKKNYLSDADRGPAQQAIVVDSNGVAEYGLIYHYEKNRYSKNIFNDKPTEKQIKYLTALAYKNDYVIIKHNFTKREASEFITYFKNYDYMEIPSSFDKYFIKGI